MAPRLVHSFINTRKGFLKCSRCGTEKHEVGKRSPIFGASLIKEYRKHGTREWGAFIACFDPRQVDIFDDGMRDDPRNFPPQFAPKPAERISRSTETYPLAGNPVSLDGIVELEINEDAYWLGINREFLVRGFNALGQPIGIYFWDICTKGEMLVKVETGKRLIGLLKGAAIRLSAKDGAQWWFLCDGEKWIEIPWWMRVKPTEDAFYDCFTETEEIQKIPEKLPIDDPIESRDVSESPKASETWEHLNVGGCFGGGLF
jgi:hypothetical protein